MTNHFPYFLTPKSAACRDDKFILYIILLALVFTITKPPKQTKIIGIIILALGVIITAVTNLWGLLSLAFFIPAGILALRYKEKPTTTTPTTTPQE
jgi:uncharacterized membrane protein